MDKECENQTFGDVSSAANTLYFRQNSLTADDQGFVDVELKLSIGSNWESLQTNRKLLRT